MAASNTVETLTEQDSQATDNSALRYHRFADSPLWNWQRRYFEQKGMEAWSKSEVPHYVTSHPYMAYTYAQVVLAYLRDLAQPPHTCESTNQPLYIIELGAGCGRFAYHFLRQFFSLLDATNKYQYTQPVCYVMTDIATSTIDSWRQHPKLKPYIDQGRLDFALFDAETDNAEADEELTLINQNLILRKASLHNPPVVIANYVFDGLRQDLFTLNKETISETWLALSDPYGKAVDETEPEDISQALANVQLNYQPQALNQHPYQNPAWNQALHHYAKQLPPCSLLFPRVALHAIEQLRALHGTDMLLLSADRGSNQLYDMALQQNPAIARHGSFSLPVNYHAIAQVLQMQGAQVWENGFQEKGLAILAALFGADQAWPETALAANTHVQQFNANDFYQIKKSLEDKVPTLSLAQMHSYLRLSQWDSKIMLLFQNELNQRLPQADHQSQSLWSAALDNAWRSYFPIGEQNDFAFALGSLAAKMHRWQQASCFFQHSLQYHGEHSATHYNLGIAHWQIAQFDEAEQQLSLAAKLDSEQSRFQTQLETLRAWRDTSIGRLGRERITLQAGEPNQSQAETGELYACLLGPHHAQGLLRQQRDPQVAQLTRVPQLRSISQARGWIESQLNIKNKTTLAIMHCELGLVGAVALEANHMDDNTTMVNDSAALFYYWIGRAFQNQGYGRQALQLMCGAASQLDIKHLFSPVYNNNPRSRRVLQSCSFHALPYAVEPQDEALHYYHKPLVPQDCKHEKIQEALPVYQTLQQLLQNTNAGHRLAKVKQALVDSEASPC